MSIEIPENMEEVAMRTALLKTRGHEVSEDEIMKRAALDALQQFIDQELDGHYDSVNYDGDQLVVTNLSHTEVGRLTPDQNSFAQDFKNNADQLLLRLETASRKIVGSR